MLPFVALLTAQGRSPIVTPYAQAKPLAIRAVKVGEPSVPRMGREDLTLDADATFDNPFDPDDVRLEARVVPQIGASYDVPGFYDQGFTRQLVNGNEVLTPVGDAVWRVRICPREAGDYRVEIVLHDRTGEAHAEARFKAVPSDAPGPIHVSPRDHRFFEHENGAAFYPVGANVCWGNGPGTFSYDQWMKDYGAVGADYARLWLDPGWVTFAMTVPGKAKDGKGVGQINLGDAWRLDYVFALARANGVNLQLCLESYNTLRDRDAYPYWDSAAENAQNGGPLRIWSEFWTDPEMDRLFRMKLRYLVARYAANANLFAWELWNEVDQVRDFDVDAVHGWHQRMAAALKALDPYGHPVTTSLGSTAGNRAIDLAPALDFFQTHLYNSPDLVDALIDQQSRKSWGRPHLVAEVGADSNGPRAKDDPDGMQIHDPIWASIASGVAGTASPWWWDGYIAPNNLYPLFGAAKRFVQGVDWPGEQFQWADLTFAYQAPTKPESHRRPNLQGWAIVGNDAVLAWFRPEGRTWARVCVAKAKIPPVPPSVVGLTGLAAGRWTVEYWDTWKGVVVDRGSVAVGIEGKARVTLPEIATDLAVKMRRQAR